MRQAWLGHSGPGTSAVLAVLYVVSLRTSAIGPTKAVQCRLRQRQHWPKCSQLKYGLAIETLGQ